MKELIEQRAYFLYLKRGKLNGYHAEDWKQAEKEIYAELDAKKKQETQRQTPVAKPEIKAAPAAAVKVAVAQAEPVKPAMTEKRAAPAPAAAAEKPAEEPRAKSRLIAPTKPAGKTAKKRK